EGAVRLIESAALREERARGRALYGGRASWPRRLWNSARLARKNTGNTALMSFRDRLFALVESSPPTEIDPHTLDTIGETRLGVIGDAFSAHPHRVIDRGGTIGFGLEYGPTTTIHLYEFADRGSPATRALGAVSLPHAVMLHDFAVTPTRALFLVSPVRIDLLRALLALGEFSKLISYHPEAGVEVIVVPLDRPEAHTRFTVDPFFQWHFAGARDDGEAIEATFVRHPDFGTFEGLRSQGPRLTGVIGRARIEPGAKRLTWEPLWDRFCEFPRVDPRFEGRADAPFTQVFLTEESGAQQRSPSAEHRGGRHLVRLDTTSGRARMHELANDLAGSEIVFVPRSHDAPEGDGWALALCHDPHEDRSHVRILDTARWEDEPIAICRFPEWVPMTFHGLWLPG
ncbi:MAG: carotenoid oxygenase family protein, partial [Deltaproteobacteria bacterium]|nr:carotenoid oxygenase family protein [Deltaproteobacteria bacterium]